MSATPVRQVAIHSPHHLESRWLLLCVALALHVADEALTGFLRVYNPTVIAFRHQLGWWPMPTFTFRTWLAGLIVAILFLAALTPFARVNARGWRVFAYIVATIMVLNGLMHTLGTVFGHTVATVRFARPMPGFWSSPLLIAAALFLLVELRRTARHRGKVANFR